MWHTKQNDDQISVGHGVMIRGNYNWVCHTWESPAKHEFSLKVFALSKAVSYLLGLAISEEAK